LSAALLREQAVSQPGSLLFTSQSGWPVCCGQPLIINYCPARLGMVLYLRGVPWALAHEAMAGVFYFSLFLWIVRQRRRR